MALCIAPDKDNEATCMCFCKWNSRWISGNKSTNRM